MNEQELFRLKNEIEKVKATVAELRGRRQQILDTLEKRWGCKTVRAGQRKLRDLAREVVSLRSKIRKGLDKIEIAV